MEFTNIMKAVYQNITKIYEDISKTIIMDTDLDSIDFPLLCESIKIDGLASFLPPELKDKLNLEDIEPV